MYGKLKYPRKAIQNGNRRTIPNSGFLAFLKDRNISGLFFVQEEVTA
jgi:hypothetical protein